MLPGVERSRGPSPLARGKQRRHSTWPTLTGTIPARAGETKRRKRGKVGSRDHPRSRGGNLCKRSFLFLGGGPSPLARGKHTPCTCRPCNQGTIPARAGETISDSARYSPLRDHPRSRGGNVALSRDGAQVWGPSPLARGKLRGADQLARPAGTIPARAGETVDLACTGSRWRDHPRSRGGNLLAGLGLDLGAGPSPLARGKHDEEANGGLLIGTIPARAGETCVRRPSPGPWRDHPRSRGGNVAPAQRLKQLAGPSPLARGKRRCRRAASACDGTIPARAGETLTGFLGLLLQRDHPRSRGGNAGHRAEPELQPGPSPLARGKLHPKTQTANIYGTIPARAGETITTANARELFGDHPRSRGGNSMGTGWGRLTLGPSPLARGKRRQHWHDRQTERTIPARAGETISVVQRLQILADHPRSRGGNIKSSLIRRWTGGPSPLARGKQANSAKCSAY